MTSNKRSRYEIGHVPDVARDEDRIQQCLCGYTARTLAEVREHCRWPDRPVAIWHLELAPQTVWGRWHQAHRRAA